MDKSRRRVTLFRIGTQIQRSFYWPLPKFDDRLEESYRNALIYCRVNTENRRKMFKRFEHCLSLAIGHARGVEKGDIMYQMAKTEEEARYISDLRKALSTRQNEFL